MPIAVVYRHPAITEEQYKRSWEAGPPVAPPPGLIVHAGVGQGADFMTVSVWESQAAYDAFAPTFAGAMRQMGLTIGTPQILPVHQVLVPARE